MTSAHLEVWGDPVAHSRSPQLHRAAYAQLGLPWSYERRRVTEASFDAELVALGETCRGLSVTMPLKGRAFAAAPTRDRYAELTGAVNTLLLGPQRRGFNTDVAGIVDAFGEAGLTALRRARILGTGATAASALVALVTMGAREVDVRARRPERAADLARIAAELGVVLTVHGFTDAVDDAEATVATLPSGTVLDTEVAARLATAGGVLLDAAYAPWPSALAARWEAAPVISGLSMLLFQAVRQVRIFTSGEPETPLPDEPEVVAVMRAALMGD